MVFYMTNNQVLEDIIAAKRKNPYTDKKTVEQLREETEKAGSQIPLPSNTNFERILADNVYAEWITCGDVDTNKVFMFTLVIIITFSTWQLNKPEDDEETERRKRATREAILGLIIAVLAYLDLKAAPFFIIWIVSYYLDK